MNTVDEIKVAIVSLSLEERAELAKWMNGWQDDDWDRQMMVDVSAGRLDTILAEVDEDIRRGGLRDLP